jgi:hypothetical protein
MVRAKVPSSVIIEKVQTSLCHFDTFPTVISELRYRGVPEEILVAMVEAPVGRPTKRVEKDTTKVGMHPVATRSESKAENTATIRSETESSPPATVTAPQNKNRSATLPLPEPARVGSGIVVNLTMPASSQSSSSPNALMPAPPERRETINPEETDKAPHVLTNSDIIKLLRGGAPVANIVEKIKGSPGNYDLSAKALMELSQAGADATVFLSMMEINQKFVNDQISPNSNESNQNKKKND